MGDNVISMTHYYGITLTSNYPQQDVLVQVTCAKIILWCTERDCIAENICDEEKRKELQHREEVRQLHYRKEEREKKIYYRHVMNRMEKRKLQKKKRKNYIMKNKSEEKNRKFYYSKPSPFVAVWAAQ